MSILSTGSTSMLYGMVIAVVLVLTVISLPSVNSYGIDKLVKDTSRRNLFQTTENVAMTVAAAMVASSASANAATDISSCPPRSQNCIRTTWTAPSGTKDVSGTMLKLLKSYPIEGQSDIDKGGWTIVKDGSDTNTISLEYKSGIGNFAKFLNGGKPFVDDVNIQVVGNVVEIRSASRIGDSDLGVNQKRLQFFVTKAREMGWDAPDPKY